jgi:hypothetical protein
MLGANALGVGWSGIFAGVFAWYANLFWLIGIILGIRRKPKPAAVVGIIAVAIACSTFAVIGQQLPGDEGNVTHMTLLRLLPGFYVWMAGLAALPLATLFRKSA